MSLKASECRKFAPNIFNRSKCQNCFRGKDAHSPEALESNRPETVPQSVIDMTRVLEVAEGVTGNPFALTCPVHFVKGTSRDETKKKEKTKNQEIKQEKCLREESKMYLVMSDVPKKIRPSARQGVG